MVHIFSGILLSHKKEWNCHFSNMDGTGGYYALWNKLDRERQILCYHQYVEPKKQTSEYNKKGTDQQI